MKIIILGHKGMLGQMAKAYFTHRGFDVITSTIYFSEDNYLEWSDFIKKYENAIILNCIGKIKQKTNNIHDLLWANAILPLQIANILQKNQFLIHPSTDCVFSGNSIDSYKFDTYCDAEDAYGWSKRLGEVALLNNRQALVVRVSIIGTDNSSNPKGLLGWFLNQTSKSELNGFDNHLWNGITTLEWCKQVETIILNKEKYIDCSLIQLGTKEIYSKYDLLKLFQEVFNTDYVIHKFDTEQSVNRTLVPTDMCINLREQLIELKSFSASHYFE